MRKAPLALLPMLGGCAGVQSALDPSGDHAARIADLSWLLFGGAAAIFILVTAALATAISGGDRARRALASPRMVAVAGIVFPIAVLTTLLAYGIWLMRESIAAPGKPALAVEVAGEQWWWRVRYTTGARVHVESANEVRIPVGQPVRFVLTSRDVIHSFWVPSLGGKVDMIPGRATTLTLTADRPGVYRGQCAEYCGGPHALMAFEVHAMPAAAFASWLERAQGPAQPAPATEAGGRTFLAAGCGACHAIRGTPANGRVGPDLSDVGGRRFLAAGTLATTPDNIAAFISDSQHIKPGNRMPSIAVLRPEELEEVSLYLAGLK